MVRLIHTANTADLTHTVAAEEMAAAPATLAVAVRLAVAVSPAAPGNPGATGTGDYGDGTRGDGKRKSKCTAYSYGEYGRPDTYGGDDDSDSGGGGKPIVLDLDGDGVELTSLDESSAFYDINGDGYLYNLGWAGADDGLACLRQGRRQRHHRAR